MPQGRGSDDGAVSLGRAVTILLTTVATIVGLAMFFLAIGPLVAGRFDLVAFNAVVFALCLWYVARVMRADRRERRAEEERLPPERRPQRRQPRRPITFQIRETATAFLIWVVIVGAISAATGLPAPVTVGVAVFAGFMLATLTVAGRHMMFRLTAEEDDGVEGGPP